MTVKLTLIQGDCLEIHKTIQNQEIDCIITDPPYFIGFASSNENLKNSGRQDWGNHTLLKPLFENLFKEYRRILKNDGKLFMFTDWRTYPSLYLSASQFMKINNLIVWNYGWIKAGQGFRFTHELILYATMPECTPPQKSFNF